MSKEDYRHKVAMYSVGGLFILSAAGFLVPKLWPNKFEDDRKQIITLYTDLNNDSIQDKITTVMVLSYDRSEPILVESVDTIYGLKTNPESNGIDVDKKQTITVFKDVNSDGTKDKLIATFSFTNNPKKPTLAERVDTLYGYTTNGKTLYLPKELFYDRH
jgi:hypothetical protein